MTDLIRFAFVLDGPEAGLPLTGNAIADCLRADTLGWVHLDAAHEDAQNWIENNLSYLDPHAVTALLAEETRPRCTPIGEGVLMVLRGVNTNEGADPEDMVSVRLWADANRIVSLSRRRVRAIEDVAQAVQAHRESMTAGAFLGLLAERLNARIEGLGRSLDQIVDELEEEVTINPGPDLRGRVVETRLRTIVFRRHTSPQRDALAELAQSDPEWMAEIDRRRIHEAHDRLTRLVEDLDAMRERMGVLREELSSQLSERLNRNMYLIGIISAVFLPLGFLTGLFGINLGGMPGAESPVAFWIFCGALVGILLVQLLLLLRLRWL